MASAEGSVKLDTLAVCPSAVSVPTFATMHGSHPYFLEAVLGWASSPLTSSSPYDQNSGSSFCQLLTPGAPFR